MTKFQSFTGISHSKRDALFAFGIRVASAALLYLSQIALARWMGGADYGVYVLMWTTVLVLGGLSHLGVNLGMIRLVPAYRATADLPLLKGLLYGGRGLALASSCTVASMGAGLLYLNPGALGQAYLGPAYLALACLPFYALTDVQDGIGRGFAWLGLALLPPYVIRPVLVLLVVAMAHVLGFPINATVAVCAALMATALAASAQTVALERRLTPQLLGPAPARYDFTAWLQISLPLLVMGMAEILLQTADVFVVSRDLTPVDVGIYYAAAKTMSLILFVHYAVGSSFANRFSSLHAQGNASALKATIAEAAKATFWPSLGLAAILALLGRPMLALFGPDFVQGYPVMIIMSLGFLARAAVGPVEHLLSALGEQKACARILAVAALLDIALNLSLVPWFGLIGAASATALALSFAALMNRALAARKLGYDVSAFGLKA